MTSIGNFIFTLAGNILFNLKITDILYTFILGKTSSFRNLNLIILTLEFVLKFQLRLNLEK